MGFAIFCVALVICIGVMVVTGVFGAIASYLNDKGDPNEWTILSWLASSIGFGICLTIILYSNGLIH